MCICVCVFAFVTVRVAFPGVGQLRQSGACWVLQRFQNPPLTYERDRLQAYTHMTSVNNLVPRTLVGVQSLHRILTPGSTIAHCQHARPCTKRPPTTIWWWPRSIAVRANRCSSYCPGGNLTYRAPLPNNPPPPPRFPPPQYSAKLVLKCSLECAEHVTTCSGRTRVTALNVRVPSFAPTVGAKMRLKNT